AYHSVQQIAAYINKTKKRDDKRKRLLEIHSRMTSRNVFNSLLTSSNSQIHIFEKKEIYAPTHCDHCGKLIFGLGRKAFVCKSEFSLTFRLEMVAIKFY